MQSWADFVTGAVPKAVPLQPLREGATAYSIGSASTFVIARRSLPDVSTTFTGQR